MKLAWTSDCYEGITQTAISDVLTRDQKDDEFMLVVYDAQNNRGGEFKCDVSTMNRLRETGLISVVTTLTPAGVARIEALLKGREK